MFYGRQECRLTPLHPHAFLSRLCSFTFSLGFSFPAAGHKATAVIEMGPGACVRVCLSYRWKRVALYFAARKWTRWHGIKVGTVLCHREESDGKAISPQCGFERVCADWYSPNCHKSILVKAKYTLDSGHCVLRMTRRRWKKDFF